jgi:hypothetical protein
MRTRITIGLQLTLAGMLLRAVLPAGWMPAKSLADGTWLAVCTGIAHRTGRQAMNMAGMPQRPGHSHHDRMRPCPFAAAAQLGRSGAPPHLSPTTRFRWRQAPHHLRHLVPVERLLETGSPRGPPALI